jgi:hypothetical protein
MDLDLIKKYKEYEAILEKLTPLRTELDFLVPFIDEKRKESEVYVKRIELAKAEQTTIFDEIAKKRNDCDNYVETQTNKINKDLKKQEINLLNLIEENKKYL